MCNFCHTAVDISLKTKQSKWKNEFKKILGYEIALIAKKQGYFFLKIPK